MEVKMYLQVISRMGILNNEINIQQMKQHTDVYRIQ